MKNDYETDQRPSTVFPYSLYVRDAMLTDVVYQQPDFGVL